MRALEIRTGDRAVVNMIGGDAISGEVTLFTKAGTVFIKDAVLHTEAANQPLDGGIQIPATSILWVQVV